MSINQNCFPMKTWFTALYLMLCSTLLYAQKPVVSGKVTDVVTGEPLAGVNIFYSNEYGVASASDGSYQIVAEPGKIRLQYRFVGYHTELRNLDLSEGGHLIINVAMTEQPHLLNEFVVSASRYEQRLSDVTVSMEVINSAQIENTHTLSIETAIQQVPGLMFLDDQVSIRSGNGYSYGVGSRVLVLLDDLPMLTGAGGEAKWDFIPLENLSQVEVLKGASSALYGSSALNGVINIRTAYPVDKPETRILYYSGLYGSPERKEVKWWGDTHPYYAGLRLSHSRMIGNLDLVAGANVYKDKGFRENENEEYVRFNINTRYRSKKISGLSGGINANAMYNKGGNFLLWLDGDSGVYRPSPAYDQNFNNSRLSIDPHITYYTPTNSRHSLKGRIFKVSYDNDTIMHNYDDSYFAEYQYLKQWQNDFSLTLGTSSTYIVSNSNLFGSVTHTASNYAMYFQTEKRHQNFRFSFGGRYEVHQINNVRIQSRPIFRAGMNYQASEYTFLRASFGQGFRYPSIAEKYAATEVGALKIFPNEELEPEFGWNAEVGAKQGFALGRIQGYLDAALFWTEYRNMIEFTFGQHIPDSIDEITWNHIFQYTGFKAFNISNARIAGFELSVAGKGKTGSFHYAFHAGYTFTDPIDKDFKKNAEHTATTDRNILKYRFYHNAKLNLDAGYKNFSTGINIDYHSLIINIDRAFEDSLRVQGIALPVFIVPGLREYRERNNKGDVLFNWRIAWEPSAAIRLSFIINNLFNREYMTRPADVGPPRTFAVQLALRL